MVREAPPDLKKKKHEGTHFVEALIVDNDSNMRPFFQTIFEQAGFTLEVVKQCSHATTKILQKGYDFILINVDLMDCRHSEILSTLKSLHPDATVVSMTSDNTLELEAHVRSQRVAYHLVQPFNKQELISVLVHVAKRKQTNQ